MLNLGEVGIDYESRLAEISSEWDRQVIKLELNRLLDKEEFDREQELFMDKIKRIWILLYSPPSRHYSVVFKMKPSLPLTSRPAIF